MTGRRRLRAANIDGERPCRREVYEAPPRAHVVWRASSSPRTEAKMKRAEQPKLPLPPGRDDAQRQARHLRTGVALPACLLMSAMIDDHMLSASARPCGALDAGRGDGVVLEGKVALSRPAMPLQRASIESCVTGTPCFAAIEFPMERRVVMVVMAKIPGQ
jgi:hypothetical protein